MTTTGTYADYYDELASAASGVGSFDWQQKRALCKMLMSKYLQGSDTLVGWNFEENDGPEPFDAFTYDGRSLVLFRFDTDALDRDAEEDVNLRALTYSMLEPLRIFGEHARGFSGELSNEAVTRAIVAKFVASYPCSAVERISVVLISMAPGFSRPSLTVWVDSELSVDLHYVGLDSLWKVEPSLPPVPSLEDIDIPKQKPEVEIEIVDDSDPDSGIDDLSAPVSKQKVDSTPGSDANHEADAEPVTVEGPEFKPAPEAGVVRQPDVEPESVAEQEPGCPPTGETDESAPVGLKGAEDFRHRLILEAKNEGYGKYRLLDILKDRLCEVDKFDDISDARCPERKVKNSLCAVDAWCFDETNDVLTLFYFDYHDTTVPGSFGKTDAERMLSKVRNFFRYSADGSLDEEVLDWNTEEGALAFTIADRFADATEELPAYSRVEFWLLTTERKTKNLALPDGTVAGIDYRVTVIDYNDFYEFDKSTCELEINFNRTEFGGRPLRMLPAVTDRTTGYSAYVGVIPGKTLANLYKEYGQRILSSNVRAFLNTTIKVNKGIQQTIKKEPKRFFAFNNGICVVCSGIKTELRNGVTLMNEATDFQIVNGGQTTASLHYAAMQKNFPLDDVQVPMKLTVIPMEVINCGRQEFVLDIAKYANSQTAVTQSDLGSNTNFQVRFQKWGFSGNCTYQNKGGVCYWYYERTRGEFKIAQNREISTKKFEARFPNRFTKIELAKWLMSWEGAPHTVSLGAQKCFTAFSKEVDAKEALDPELTFCTPAFFKQAVAKGILFRAVDKLVLNADWYKRERSYKANIVTYTIALFAHTIRQKMGSDMDLDWQKIWDRQCIDDALLPLLDALAQQARANFDREDRSVHDVGEWVKKEKCWELLREQGADFGNAQETVRALCKKADPSFSLR